MLTASYPNGPSWLAAGKDHIDPDPESITVYVVGLGPPVKFAGGHLSPSPIAQFLTGVDWQKGVYWLGDKQYPLYDGDGKHVTQLFRTVLYFLRHPLPSGPF
jgi:hypothetical protein